MSQESMYSLTETTHSQNCVRFHSQLEPWISLKFGRRKLETLLGTLGYTAFINFYRHMWKQSNKYWPGLRSASGKGAAILETLPECIVNLSTGVSKSLHGVFRSVNYRDFSHHGVIRSLHGAFIGTPVYCLTDVYVFMWLWSIIILLLN